MTTGIANLMRDTGDSAPRATWKLDGSLVITTEENASKPV